MTKQERDTRPELGGGGWSRDWRMWTVVALMLAAMAVYILSLDNEIAPGEPGQPLPTATETK
jgi:hypothetical protein